MKGEQMSLLHEFVAVRQPTNKKILYSENIPFFLFEYISILYLEIIKIVTV